jgi:hypothetical protein|tara:strand:+ start:318 stop:503 length:186 start_codon:yes stop_codon:yes gene_type:complete
MKTFKQFMDEDAPINNVGGGQIAGTKEAGDDPPVRKKKKKIYLGKGSRRYWLQSLKGNGKS